MSAEDHPKYREWLAALDKLIQAKDALKRGQASKADVDKAVETYCKIADDL